jgi:RND family efflux transporter MFP subunit
MPLPGPNLDLNIAAFASRLFEVSETSPRARILAQTVVDLFPAATAIVYLLQKDEDGHFWSARATVGDGAEPDRRVEAASGTLGSLIQNPQRLLYEGRTLAREDYAHLNIRRTLRCLACVPLLATDEVVGAIEILSFDALLDSALLHDLELLCEVAARALLASQAYEEERHSSLSSITRVTQFYDIEKVFSSTLEMDELLPIIGSKTREMLECVAVNVWLVQGDGSLLLMHQSGLDPTTQDQMIQKGGEGIAGDVSDTGEAVLIESPEDERLLRRNGERQGGLVESIIAAPLIDKGSLVGVVEAVNRLDGKPFDDDDLFVLSNLNETASIALYNASLLLAERKVEVLEALVHVSQEITSTLDLDRVLQAVVNGPAAVIAYERAAIALEQRGRMQLRAISGAVEFNPEDPAIALLSQILQWASLLQEPALITQKGDAISADREETRVKFEHYFSQTGMRAFHAVPLADEEGRVGVLSFESSDPDFLTVAHLEMIKVLGSQATVALRNASLYKEVPFIGVLQPLMQKKQRFLALERHRKALVIASAFLAALFLALFPLPLRVDGTATVAPGHAAHVGADVEGPVKQVLVREGDHVQKGAIIGTLEDWDYRSALAEAEAKRDTAMSLMDRALAANDDTEAGIQRAQTDYWTSEVARAKERLDRTVLRSPIDGVIATPHLENLVGHKLKFGETFTDVIDNSQAMVDLTIDQSDLGLVATGQPARIKLDAFPASTFKGQVVVLSPEARLDGQTRTFYARIAVPNPEGLLRAGMQGRGKVSTGWHPAGKVFFRQSVMWIWSKLWYWLGW